MKMHRTNFTIIVLAVYGLLGVSEAYFRVSCGTIQSGRIDPVISPGKIAGHAHKIAGASNIGLNSTYDDLQKASCSSCEVQADKSAYWTPIFYYKHANGSFEEVPNQGMTIYYEGRGDNRTNVQAFPPGFRMVSGDNAARSYDNNTMTYKDARPVADRVSFACLADNPSKETPNLATTDCKNGLRAQIHFQSCWDGVNLYKEDQSHVAYMSGMDNGLCPPTHPVSLVHMFFEVLYSVDKIKQDGGQFVFSQGDPTGYGFHGDFLNGWNMTVQNAAVSQCANTDGNMIDTCEPFQATHDNNYALNCPERPSIIDEPVNGMVSKLPGCINITPGPEKAKASDMACSGNSNAPTIKLASNYTGPMTVFKPTTGTIVDGWQYLGCANEIENTRALSKAAYANETTMSNAVCQAFCASKSLPLAGTENGRECYCGTTLGAGSSLNANCNSIICAGNSTEYCGGPDRLSVWNNNAFRPATVA